MELEAGRRSRIVVDDEGTSEKRSQTCPTVDHNGADAKKDSVSAYSK